MTKDEAAAQLNGNVYGSEGSPELFAAMKEAGLVALFGYSDDNIELRGVIDDEVGAGDGTEIHLTPGGLLKNECDEGDRCPYFAELQEKAAVIEIVTPEDTDQGLWAYKTEIPHAKFTIMEDDWVYGGGIVIDMREVQPAG